MDRSALGFSTRAGPGQRVYEADGQDARGECVRRDAVVVASMGRAPSHSGSELQTLARAADWLHVRAELCGDLDPDWLRGRFRGSLLYSLARYEGSAEGAAGDDSRHDRLRRAARRFDLVELEAPHDLTPQLLDHVPPAKRLLAWQGVADDVGVLGRQFDQMAAVGARVYKLVCTARRPADALVPLAFLASLRRDDTLAYAAGAGGFWSRLVAPHLGCPMIFARLGDEPPPVDVPTVMQLVRDYGLPRLTRPRELFGIVGNPVLGSPSPRLHNAGYRALGRAALYLPFHVDSFAAFWDDVVGDQLLETLGMTFEGFTVVSPHKELAKDVSSSSTEIVRRGASCNLLRRADGAWTSETTDPEGVLDCLRASGLSVRGKRAAVVGCGGAGRPIAAALAMAGSEVTLVNRGLERGRWAERILGMAFVPLNAFKASDVSVVVHATPLGRGETDPLPFEPEVLPSDAVLVDLVYAPASTPLVSRARAHGCHVFDGYDVLLAQAHRQFERMTGSALPAALARDRLNRELAEPPLSRRDLRAAR